MSFLDQFEAAGAVETNVEWLNAVSWREKRKPSVWASQVRRIAPGQSPLSTGKEIPYDHSIMPHAVEPMDAADDKTVNKIVLWWPIRDGKTIGVCGNIIGRTVTDDPGNIYSVHPIKDDVDRFSIGDIEPMIEACLKEYFFEKRSRESGRTITFKKFIGGWLRIVNAGSVTKFRGTSVKVLLLHELDALDPESIFKAFGRTTGFADAIIVLESTGTLAPAFDENGKIIYRSRIHEAFDQGDKRKWFGPCRKCDALQWIKFDQFWFPAGHMERAVFLCERCEADHDEKRWHQFQMDARWYPTAGLDGRPFALPYEESPKERDIEKHFRKAKAVDPTVRSYWRNGFNSLLPTGKGYATKLHQFVADGLAAQTSRERLMIWTQEIKCELWDPEGDSEPAPDWKKIYDRREEY